MLSSSIPHAQRPEEHAVGWALHTDHVAAARDVLLAAGGGHSGSVRGRAESAQGEVGLDGAATSLLSGVVHSQHLYSGQPRAFRCRHHAVLLVAGVFEDGAIRSVGGVS
jgi:hypothetical protein